MADRFSGQTVLVTGAAGGIGAAVAQGFAREGATVVASDLRVPDPGLGLTGLPFVACDVRDRAAVDHLVVAVAATHGPIRCLIHAAALLGGSGPFEDVSAETFAAYLEVNVVGTFNVAQAVARHMIAAGVRGSIVTFASVNALAAERHAAPYVASKGAVRMLTRAMAVDLARHGIRANTILPGPITVPRNAELFGSPDVAAAFAAAIPAGRPGRVDEIVAAALYLADPANSFTTGTDLVVDGGLMAALPLP
ncbi:MAG: SDR family oxidoreductase [Devosia sp.]|nr:SDR family oxidoreductase [Devosia sp.]